MPHKRTYPIALVTQCRRMGEAGWTPYRIQQLLLEQRVSPCPSRWTIERWVNEARDVSHRQRERQRQATSTASRASFRLTGGTPAYRAAFMRRLRAEGVSVEAIAKVHGVVFGKPIAGSAVRRIVSAES